ncbi:hypothetical protein GCM10027066_30400 [Dyella jejuensis]
MDQETHIPGSRDLIAKRNHLAKFPGGVDVQKRDRRGCGVKRLAQQMQQDGGILADGIQHDRSLEAGYHFSEDMDAFGFKRVKM